MMGMPALLPMRVVPARAMSRKVPASRMPPAALTCTSAGTCSRMRHTSATVAPPVEKPVEVLT